MKHVKKVFALGTSLFLMFGAMMSLSSHQQKDKEVQVAEAIDDYQIYHNEDLGFVTRDPGDTRIVKGDVDGGEQTKGNVLSSKSELKLNFKKTVANYWFGVGGYAIYSSNHTTIRFLTLSYNSNSAYGRNAQKSNLVMKTADGSEAMTDAYSDGKLFSDYTDITLRLDMSDLTAVKLEFFAEYGGKTYYPFDGTTKIDSYTYSATPTGFGEEDTYRAMAGANATDSGVAILKFNTHLLLREDLTDVITGVTGKYEWDAIGQYKFEITLSKDIFQEGSGYLDDNPNNWKDENGNTINLQEAILINGKTFKYWVDYPSTHSAYSSKDASNGVYDFAMCLAGTHSPASIYLDSNAITFRFCLDVFAMDNLEITFKADGFKAYNNNTICELTEDLTYYSTLNDQTNGSFTNLYDNRVVFVQQRNEIPAHVSIIETQDLGENTATNGGKYRRYLIKTNIKRDPDFYLQPFAADNYRYFYDNILMNGMSLASINAWARMNHKDFDVYNDSSTQNPDYETNHPTGSPNPKYDLAVNTQMPTDQTDVWFWIRVPYQLMTDLSIDRADIAFSIRDGSAWHTLDKNNNHIIIRNDADTFEPLINAAIDELEGYVDPSLYRSEDREEISLILSDAEYDLRAAVLLDDIETIVDTAKGSLDAYKTDAELTKEEHIDAVIALIDAIPDPVSESDANTIKAALEAYAALTTAEQSEVPTEQFNKLYAAYEALEAIELASYKTIVAQQVNNTIDLDRYFDTQRSQVSQLIEQLNSSIAAATNKAQVDEAVDTFYLAFNQIKTAKELAIEELDAIDLTIYRQAEKENVESIIASAKAAIALCDNAAEIENVLERTDDAIALIKTDAQMTAYEELEEARASAISQINNCYDELKDGNYTNANKQLLEILKINGVFAVEIAISQAEITAAVTSTIEAMNAIETIPNPQPEPTYTVTFDANGGTGTMTQITGINGQYILPSCGFTAPAGQEFAGWKVNNQGDILQPNAIVTVYSDTQLIAQWKVINSGGDSGDGGSSHFEPEDEFGCNGSLVASSLLISGISLVGVALMLFRKKKDN